MSSSPEKNDSGYPVAAPCLIALSSLFFTAEKHIQRGSETKPTRLDVPIKSLG